MPAECRRPHRDGNRSGQTLVKICFAFLCSFWFKLLVDAAIKMHKDGKVSDTRSEDEASEGEPDHSKKDQ